MLEWFNSFPYSDYKYVLGHIIHQEKRFINLFFHTPIILDIRLNKQENIDL